MSKLAPWRAVVYIGFTHVADEEAETTEDLMRIITEKYDRRAWGTLQERTSQSSWQKRADFGQRPR